MPELTPEIATQILGACKAGADEASAAFGRALDMEPALAIGEPDQFDASALAAERQAAALVVVLTVGGKGALVLLPESSGLVPDWCAGPDPTGQSKLDTLAQELGMILLPEEYAPDAFATVRVDDLGAALDRGMPANPGSIIPLELSTPDGRKATASLVWPVEHPEAVLGQATGQPDAGQSGDAGEREDAESVNPAETAVEQELTDTRTGVSPRSLPNYTRSLLRISVPVVVTLAQKRQPLGRILDLGLGSIIQFEKSCDEMLELDVGGHPVATGEAVKVGDKFGLRISSIILPDERFKPVKAGRQPTGSGE